MKKIITTFIINSIIITVSLNAQLKPSLENEYAKSLSLGPILTDSGIMWNLILENKTDDITKIEGFEINNLNKNLKIKEDKKISKGKLIINSEILPISEFDWIFEEGNSYLFFSVELTSVDNKIHKLNIPLSFSNKTKENLRIFINTKYKITKKINKIPYYRNFDGRRWFVGNSGENEDIFLLEMVPEGINIKKWKELYRLNILKKINANNRDNYLGVFKKNLSKDCPSLKYKVLSESKNEILFKWSHTGCNGWPESSEITRIRSNDNESISYSFAYHKEDIPNSLEEIYIEILKNEK